MKNQDKKKINAPTPSVEDVKSKLDQLFEVYREAFRLAYAGYSYKEIRARYSEFNSQIVANAIYDAKALRETAWKTHHYPKKLNPQPLLRNQDFRIEGNKLSIIYKPRGRLVVNVFPSEKQLKEMESANVKGARLVKRDDKYFLNLVLEKEVHLPRWKECETIIGVDIGINYIAVCSALTKDDKFTNPIFFHGGEWKHICDRKRKVTRYKEYKHLTNRQNEILHTVSKRIVEYAKKFPKPIIVMERLSNLENENRENKKLNFLLHNWARRKFQEMIEYKAMWEGIPVAYVSPAYTSMTCHYCGSRGEREGVIFKCSKCGREYNADLNASMNLAKKFRKFLNEQKAIKENEHEMKKVKVIKTLRLPIGLESIADAQMHAVRLFRQLPDEPKAMIGKCSARGISPLAEGDARLPVQALAQPENGSQMNRMKVARTVRLPLG